MIDIPLKSLLYHISLSMFTYTQFMKKRNKIYEEKNSIIISIVCVFNFHWQIYCYFLCLSNRIVSVYIKWKRKLFNTRYLCFFLQRTKS